MIFLDTNGIRSVSETWETETNREMKERNLPFKEQYNASKTVFSVANDQTCVLIFSQQGVRK